MPAISPDSGDLKMRRHGSPSRSSEPKCGNKYGIGETSVGSFPLLVSTLPLPPAVRNSPGVGAVREGFQEEVALHDSQRLRWPEKSVGQKAGGMQ